jgi:hypothetical protein
VIHILGDRDDPATTEIVVRAFERSFTRGQVFQVDSLRDISTSNAVVVAVSPGDETAELLDQVIRRNGKLILQGTLRPAISQLAGIEPVAITEHLAEAADCKPAPVHAASVSRAALVYSKTGLGTASPLRSRYFARFDFTDEWNNLGYGRIGVGDNRWSIDQLARNCATPIAEVLIDGELCVGAAVTLRDLPHGSVLWFARPVGAVDGQDWAVVEAFISAHRANGLPCRPYLRGIPHGYGGGVSMRLDCDEDIASARPLFELYRLRNRPMSLAIRTGQPEKPENLTLMQDVVHAGGSILSHSVNHKPGWSGSAESAEREARASKTWLERRVSGVTIRYAVSPFHQNPRYVPGALARAGYEGFIGGSIAQDPEYLLARAGIPPFSPPEVVSHSQSCMLHGDSMLSQGDPLRIFKEAFRLARDGGEFFGYLDHPFSERYTYGWQDEEKRIAAHSDYLDFIEMSHRGKELLFVNEDTCLDFIKGRAAADIEYDQTLDRYTISKIRAANFPLSIGFHGNTVEAHHD